MTLFGEIDHNEIVVAVGWALDNTAGLVWEEDDSQ